MSASAINLSVGEAELGEDGPLGSSGLAMDADNLVPGQQIHRCIQVGYSGGVDDVSVRLFGRAEDGSGLERFLDTEVDVGVGTSTDCTDFVASTDRSFEGSLEELWHRHTDFASGIVLDDQLADGQSFTIRIAVALADDDRAQGLATAFWLMFEVRP